MTVIEIPPATPRTAAQCNVNRNAERPVFASAHPVGGASCSAAQAESINGLLKEIDNKSRLTSPSPIDRCALTDSNHEG